MFQGYEFFELQAMTANFEKMEAMFAEVDAEIERIRSECGIKIYTVQDYLDAKASQE